MVCLIAVIVLVVLVELPLLVYVGSLSKQAEWVRKQGKSAFVGIGSVTAVVLFIISICAVLHVSDAKADDQNFKLLPYAYIDFGWDISKKTSPQCALGEDADKLGSNLNAVVGLFSYHNPDRFWFNRVDGLTYYNHQSGFICEDRRGGTDDAIGVQGRLYIFSW